MVELVVRLRRGAFGVAVAVGAGGLAIGGVGSRRRLGQQFREPYQVVGGDSLAMGWETA